MPTLLVEAFGRLSPDAIPPGDRREEEDLYSVFRAHAELMAWSTTGGRPGPVLWGMNDAALTTGVDGARIGWVQVGLEAGVEPVLALPALIRCLDDALRRFGAVELSELRVTGSDLPRARPLATGELVGGLNWFNAAPVASADAVVVIADASPGGPTETEVVAGLRHLNTGPFAFGPRPTEPRQPPTEGPDGLVGPAGGSLLAVSVTLPEWTATAAAWALAVVILATDSGPGDVRSLDARITSTAHRGPRDPVA